MPHSTGWVRAMAGSLLALACLGPACGGTVSGTGNSDGGQDGRSTCNVLRSIPPVLTVTNAATGKAICDAEAVDAGATGPGLYSCGSSGGCSGTCPYVVDDLAAEGSATFDVTVSAPGFSSATVTGLETRYCGCGPGACPSAQTRSVALSPLPPGADGGSTEAGTDARAKEAGGSSEAGGGPEAGGSSDAATGVPCGSHRCPSGSICCYPSCGICGAGVRCGPPPAGC